MKMYEFDEPHPTGGHCRIRVTEEDAISYQKKILRESKKCNYKSDQQALDDFITIHWASEINVCTECNGNGFKYYDSTATWRGGIGGAAVTKDVCDVCWGSGDDQNPLTDLKKLDQLKSK